MRKEENDWNKSLYLDCLLGDRSNLGGQPELAFRSLCGLPNLKTQNLYFTFKTFKPEKSSNGYKL